MLGIDNQRKKNDPSLIGLENAPEKKRLDMMTLEGETRQNTPKTLDEIVD